MLAQRFFNLLISGNSSARALFYEVWPGIDNRNIEPWRQMVAAHLPLWECAASQVNLNRPVGTPEMKVIPLTTRASSYDASARVNRSQESCWQVNRDICTSRGTWIGLCNDIARDIRQSLRAAEPK